jgi:hypothetical protein
MRINVCRLPTLAFWISAVAVLTGAPAAAEESARDFTGEYVMNGQGSGPSDAPYSGTCSIKRDGTNYQVSCFNPAVRHTYSGRGIANGDTLAIFIGDRLQGDHNGVFLGEYLVVYRLQPDGSLSGSWVYANGSDEGSETLRPK